MAAGISVGCFLAAILILIPLPLHWRVRNIPILSVIAWLFASNIIDGINSIIWAGNVREVATVWCDIATKIQIGGSMALPACCLCICVHLERISSARQSQSILLERKRRMIFELVMCWLVPFIRMALHYIVQGHRFDIFEDFGCRANTYNSVQSILLVWVPTSIATVLTFVFASLALHHFLQRRIMFARHLQHSGSALTPSRYFRLMAMAVVLMVWSGFILSINLWFTIRHRLRPWTSWDDVHYNFSRIDKFPLSTISKLDLTWTYVGWWANRASALIFFLFFAFGQDAVRQYASAFNTLRGMVTKASLKVWKRPYDSRSPPMFTPTSPPFSKFSDSTSAYTCTDSETKRLTPFYLSSRDMPSSPVITPGAHFSIVNDTRSSVTVVFQPHSSDAA